MIYRGRERSVDTDRVLMRFMKSGVVYVAPHDRESRVARVERLESEGFRQVGVVVGSEGSTRSKLPLSINLREKAIESMGNITCAAGAASCKVIIGVEEFYMLYEAWKIFRELK